jgi:hypothetical protein
MTEIQNKFSSFEFWILKLSRISPACAKPLRRRQGFRASDLTPFNDHGHALAATNAKGGKAKVDFSAFHFVKESDDQPCARAPNGMAE